MGTLLNVGGILLLVGGLGQLLRSVHLYRRGGAWRSVMLMATALTAYGGLTLTGLLFNGTLLGAALVWIIAAATWAAWWFSRRERAPSAR